MALRIALDASSAAKKERTGVARYATCLLDELFGESPEDQFIVGYRLSRLRRRRYRYLPKANNAKTRFFSEQMNRLWLGPVDIFHGLDARIPRNGDFGMVVTLHDVAPLRVPAIASEGFREKKRAAYEWIARKADRIICVSQATQEAFQELYEIPDNRFSVIYHGLEARFKHQEQSVIDEVLERHEIRGPFLLFVGLLSTRKNCVNLVRAFEKIADDRPELQLVLAGGHAHGFDELEEEISRSSVQDRIILPGFVSDDDLPKLYSAAVAFVFPSVNEGFGIPILEAMACGTPVVAANTSVSREVAGDDAILCNTMEIGAFANALLQITAPDGMAEEYRTRGESRAREYSWKIAAQKTIEVYHEVAERRGSTSR